MGRWNDASGLSARQLLDVPPVWLVGALVLVWLQTRLFAGLTYDISIMRLIGGVLICAGIALMFWAIAAFRSHNTSVVPHQMPARIITSGPFARSRNPIYLGDVMVLAGAVFWWGAWPSVVLIPIFGWILTRRFIAPEEARMKENFGQEFDDFREKTPRWL